MNLKFLKKSAVLSFAGIIFINASANALSFSSNTKTTNNNNHPCAKLIELEKSQIEVVKAIRNTLVVKNLAEVTLDLSNVKYFANQSLNDKGLDLTKTLIDKGNNALAVADSANGAVQAGKSAINVLKFTKGDIEAREQRLDKLINDANYCTTNGKAITQQIVNEIALSNSIQIGFLKESIKVQEGVITVAKKITSVGVALLAVSFVTFQYYKNKPTSITSILLRFGSAFMGVGTTFVGGFMYASQGIPVVRLKSELSDLEQNDAIIKKYLEELGKL